MVILNIVKILFTLGFLVLIHEGGHFLVAKAFHVKVNEFSIGFGKKILSKKKGETEYNLRIVPLGGFVSMLGEDERSDDERSFSKQSIPKRLAIVVAGATVNIVFGLIVYFLLLAISGNYATKTIESVAEDMPAALAGIEANDEIVEVNGEKVKLYSDIANKLAQAGTNDIEITVNRNGEFKKFNLAPKKVEQDGQEKILIGVYFKPSGNSFKERIYYSFFETTRFIKFLGGSVISIFTKGINVQDMTGPIGISKTVAKTSSVYEFIYLLAIISLSLGITNLLPIPALDGGKILILIIEAIRRKPMKEKTEIAIQLVGFSFLILLSLYISYIDILRFF